MAFSIVLPLQIPALQAEGHAPILAEDTAGERGLDVVLEALQAEYGATTLAAHIYDDYLGIPALASTGALGTGVLTYYYRCKTPRYDGTSTPVDIWLYVVRSTAEGGGNNWSITLTNTTNATFSTQVVNGGAITTGTWWQMPSGTCTIDETADYNDWTIQATTVAGVGTRAVYAMVVVPQRNRATLPTLAGGYTNGVVPLDTAIAGTPGFLGVNILRDLNYMAVEQWKRGTGMVLCGAFANRVMGLAYNAGSGGYDCHDRVFVRRPPRVASLVVWFRGGGAGTARATLAPDALEQSQVSVAIAAATWSSVTLVASGISYGSISELRIESTAALESVCAWWADAVY